MDQPQDPKPKRGRKKTPPKEQSVAVVEFPSKAPEDNPVPQPRMRALGGLTKDNLVEYQEELLVANARTVLPAMFRSIAQRLINLDQKAADQAMALYGYTKSSPGVIINNMQQNNANSADDNNSTYFEQIIRKLEDRDRPNTQSGMREAEVIDV